MQFVHDNHRTVDVAASFFQLAFRFFLLHAEAADTQRLFEYSATVLGTSVKYSVHTSLSDNAVTFLAQAYAT